MTGKICGLRTLILLLGLMMTTLSPATLQALEPGEALENPAEEARARSLMAELRCLVCQNETIEASPSPFAGEVRNLVREQIAAGRSDAEVKSYLTVRYGDAILFRPTLSPSTWFLWMGPFLLLGIGGVIVVISIRASGKALREEPLSEAEQEKLNAMLGEDNPPSA